MRVLRLLVASILFVSSYAWADSILSVQPTTTNVMTGTSFALMVNISGITNLSAFQFDLTFNPSVLSATSIVEGSFLSGAGSTFFIPGTIGSGVVAFTADTLIGPGPGASGSGTLAMIDFSALMSGTSAINLSNIFLLNSTGGNISFSVSNGNVIVGNISTVPEPESLRLMLTGLSGIILLLKAQTRKAPRQNWRDLV